MTETDIELEKEFVPRKQAAALRDLGFDEKCMAYHGRQDTMMGMLYSNLYNGNTFHNAIATPSEMHLDVYAPTYRQAFKFFREKYNMTSFINTHITNGKHSCAVIHDMYNNKSLHPDLVKTEDKAGTAVVFDEYEDAELACLEKMITLALNKSNKS